MPWFREYLSFAFAVTLSRIFLRLSEAGICCTLIPGLTPGAAFLRRSAAAIALPRTRLHCREQRLSAGPTLRSLLRNVCRPLKRTQSLPLCFPGTYVPGYLDAAAARLVRGLSHQRRSSTSFVTDCQAPETVAQ